MARIVPAFAVLMVALGGVALADGGGAAQTDPVREAVLKSLASYMGIAGLVVALVGGIKAMWKTWTAGKEPMLALLLTYLTGAVAKLALPAVYPGKDVVSWTLHLFVLLVVATGANVVHDKVVNAMKGKDVGA